MQAPAPSHKDRVTCKEVPAKSGYAKRGYRWMVESRFGGKRTRKFFRHGEAEERDAHIEEQEELLADMDKDHRKQTLDRDVQRDLSEAVKLLEPWGVTLSTAAAFYVAYRETEAKRDATTIEEAKKAYLDDIEKRELDDKTRRRANQTLKRFSKAFPERTIASLQGEDIQLWWEDLGGVVNQRANRTDVNTFLNWLVKSPKFPGVTNNPTPPAPPLPKRKAAKQILTDKQVGNLLAHASEEMLPAIVAQVFMGIRKEESLRLRWDHFDWEEQTLTVTEEIAKGGANHARINDIPPNAWKWLKPYRENETGRMLPTIKSLSAYDKALQALRKKAGWGEGNPWPKNALRRTFISCHYATHGNVGKTAAVAGTSERVIFTNYRALVKKSLAAKLWRVVPADPEDGAAEKVTEFPAA
ncbi:MAG: hypothetical protein ACQKBU_01955 [Verrucomicrobiales bacterium]|nr:site-specific integrase [Verrucomicrobiota bacterium JB025]